MAKIMAVYQTIFPTVLFFWMWVSCANADNQTLPNCLSNCGEVRIPYPFGVGEGCYRDKGFQIICNYTETNSSTPFLGINTKEVVEISLKHVRLKEIACYNSYNVSGESRSSTADYGSLDLSNSPFTFSNTQNKLFAVGCDIFAHITDLKSNKFISGCASLCEKEDTDVINGSCSGMGCCQTSIPKGLKALNLELDSIKTKNRLRDPKSHSSYAGLQDAALFDFDLLRFSVDEFIEYKVSHSVVLDWTIGEETCEEARKNSTSYACQENNTYCVNSANGPGYRCNCTHGYEGNPYVANGCQDIDECKGANNCLKGTSCMNGLGTYYCVCPFGFHGDGRRYGLGCIPHGRMGYRMTVILIGCAVGVGLLVLVACGFLLYRELKKRKLIKLKQRFFKKNGGLLLEQQLSSGEGNIEKTKVFVAEELERATDNFSVSRILGKGGSGTVYKGMLFDGRIVAIKKSKVVDDSQIGQFINELVILSHINHRHIVQLFGCCLETEVPLLAYEFVSNGTLSNHLHDEDYKESISWDNRLRIATEIAGALSYMHSSATTPIFHRDIKSSNILLDENLKAKVSDFGISRSVPYGSTHITTLVQGTFGYLDPEYFHSSQFTDKSDVYSFGVVLVELLTGQRPISSTRPEEEKNLAINFISSVKENRVLEILETRVRKEGNKEELLAISKLAKRCLNLVGKKRPTMKDVTTELERLRRTEAQQYIPQNHQDTRYCQYDSTSISMSGPESEDTRLILED